MSTDQTNEVLGRASNDVTRLLSLRKNICLVIIIALFVVVGMTLFSYLPVCNLTWRGGGLLLSVFATLILGVVLGSRTRHVPHKVLYWPVFVLALKIGVIWIPLVELAEYFVTYLKPSFAQSFPTTSTMVEHYPLMLVFVIGVVVIGFLLGYKTDAVRVGGLARIPHGISVGVLCLIPLAVGAIGVHPKGLNLTPSIAEYLYARPGYGFVSKVWMRVSLSKKDEEVEAVWDTAEGVEIYDVKYRFDWHVQKDPEKLIDTWHYSSGKKWWDDCSHKPRTHTIFMDKGDVDGDKWKWLDGARITGHVTLCRKVEGTSKCPKDKENKIMELATVRSDYYRFCGDKNNWNVVYDAPR